MPSRSSYSLYKGRNPYYDRLMIKHTYSPRTFRLHTRLKSIVVIGLVVFGLAVFQMIIGRSFTFFSATTLLGGGVGMVFLPALLGLLAAWYTARDVTQDEYEVIKLTRLDDGQIIGAYWRASLNHLFFQQGVQVLAGFTGLIILWVLAAGWRLANDTTLGRLGQLHIALFFMMLLGIMWFCHALGVTLAIIFRRETSAILLAAILGILLSLGSFLFVVTMFQSHLEPTDFYTGPFPYGYRQLDTIYTFSLIIVVTAAIAPYLLTPITLWIGERFVRH